MKSLPFFHIDAFTPKSFGGNPAGVVPNADSLTEVEKQKIANELNLSETAFLLQSSDDTADDYSN
ncbi:PhzF family phenazine biosynthesis protein [Niallia taxi]|uniref:PhzF family phenazine biosynthesis protein n=1 Tax=Niallia taxi TaxID=2499688 RepID=UPI001642E4ED|nr:PhzF family phenazine biosynthesis protein [Niallia taxi]MED3963344.1 PhzF family phenazine biosynthesis protein [Niallia taxi]